MKKSSKSLKKYMMVEIILLKVNMLNSGGSTGEIWMHGAQHANSVNPAPKTENTHFLYFLKLGNPWPFYFLISTCQKCKSRSKNWEHLYIFSETGKSVPIFLNFILLRFMHFVDINNILSGKRLLPYVLFCMICQSHVNSLPTLWQEQMLDIQNRFRMIVMQIIFSGSLQDSYL